MPTKVMVFGTSKKKKKKRILYGLVDDFTFKRDGVKQGKSHIIFFFNSWLCHDIKTGNLLVSPLLSV